MTLVVVQIPCLNEEDNLAQVIHEIPRRLSGVDAVKVLVVDDGSTDSTSEVARKAGADRVVRHTSNQGLAAAYSTGLRNALEMGADILVNTDADNQYPGEFIGDLIAPIIAGSADVTIGARPIGSIDSFSFTKKILQRLGSRTVRWLAGVDVVDAPSGFRAMTRETAQLIFIYTRYTYTLESLVQLGVHGCRIASVPIQVNETTRPSRLVRGTFSYVLRSASTIIRVLMIYRSLRILGSVGALLLLLSVALGVRYLGLLAQDPEAGHVQSLVLAAILSIAGLLFLLTGFLGDLLAANRKLLEDLRARTDSSVAESMTRMSHTQIPTGDSVLGDRE